MNNISEQYTNTFPSVDQFENIIVNYQAIKNYPFCIDIIDTHSKVYDEYYDLMIQRMARYPNLQYFFLTKSPKSECYNFLYRYPLFMKQVNFVVFTKEMQKIIKAYQIPFCCFISEKNQILYKGPVATQNYALIISRLNEIKKPHQDVVKVIKEPELKNVELSMLLAGLSTRHRESTVHLIPKKSEKLEPLTSNLFSTQHECPLIKSRVHSQSLNLIKVQDMELGETQLPLLQQLEQKALPNNCANNIEALKRVQILKQIKRPVDLQTVDEWAD
ncbi:Conserved_hypothetical protein [Hexamita inflata]|uniref:Uncharacterized protein n=1 Tax=Hexamita inflata TaxID=28002 RepID=A0AA86RAX6_9EUKA|nr:Conserved hypothetical protein [Hexamita inflata]